MLGLKRSKYPEPVDVDYSNIGLSAGIFKNTLTYNIKKGEGAAGLARGYLSQFYWAINACERLIIDQILSAEMEIRVRGRKVNPRWVNKPNMLDDGDSFNTKAIISILRDGNIFVDRIRRDGNVPLFPIFDPFTVDTFFLEEENRIKYTANNSTVDHIINRDTDLKNPIHVTKGLLPGQIRGFGLVPILEQLFEIGRKTKLHNLRSLDLLKSPLVAEIDIASPTPDQRQQVQNSISNSLNVDSENSLTIIALGKNEKISYPSANINTDLLRNEKTIASQIASLYGVDYSLINIVLDNSSDTYSNESDRLNVLYNIALKPVAKELSNLYEKMIGSPDVKVTFDFDELLSGNMVEQANQMSSKASAAKSLADAGYSKEEINKILHFEELDQENELRVEGLSVEQRLLLGLDREGS